MKKLIGLVIFQALLLVSCSNQDSNSKQIVPDNSKTLVLTPIVSEPTHILPTQQPTITPVLSTATQQLPQIPVSLNTPVPIPVEKISESNLSSLTLLADYQPISDGRKLTHLSGDGTLAYVVSAEGVDIYNTKNAEFIRHLDVLPRLNSRGYVNDFNVLQVNKNGSRFIIWTSDRELKVMTSEGKVLLEVELNSPNGDSALSPDGVLLAYDDGSLWDSRGAFKIINIDTEEIVLDWKGGSGGQVHGESPKFSPDSKFLATRIRKGGGDAVSGEVYVWNTSTWKKAANYSIDSYGQYAFSETGTILALTDTEGVRVWDMQNNKSILHQKNETKCNNDRPQIMVSPQTELVGEMYCSIFKAWNIKSGEKVVEKETNILNLDSIRLDKNGDIIEFHIPEAENTPKMNPTWTGYLYPNYFDFNEDNSKLISNCSGSGYEKRGQIRTAEECRT